MQRRETVFLSELIGERLRLPAMLVAVERWRLARISAAAAVIVSDLAQACRIC